MAGRLARLRSAFMQRGPYSARPSPVTARVAGPVGEIRDARKGEQGFALFDVLLGVIVLGLVYAGLAPMIADNVGRVREQNVAQQLRTVSDAARLYVRDNYQGLLTDAKADPDSITQIDFAVDLVAGEYLLPNFPMLNAYGQEHEVWARSPNATTDALEVLVVTTGGRAAEPLEAARIANLAGAHAGYIGDAGSDYLPAEGIAEGTTGWTKDVANEYPGAIDTAGGETAADLAGHFVSVAWFADGAFVSDFMSRLDTGDAESSTMRTTLFMGGHDVLDVGTVTAEDVVVSDVTDASGRPRMASEALYDVTLAEAGDTVEKPRCPAGMEPMIVVTPTVYSDPDNDSTAENIQGIQAYATDPDPTDVAQPWTVRLRALTDEGTAWRDNWEGNGLTQMMVLTKCRLST